MIFISKKLIDKDSSLGGVLMELDNFKKWLDHALPYQSGNFWEHISDENTNPAPTAQKKAIVKKQEIFPKCDIYEKDGELVVEIEIPGVNKDDLHVSINEQILLITGECRSLEPNRKYFLKERVNQKFKKELTLPFPVLPNKGCSMLSNGILVIHLPVNEDGIEDIPILFNE
jgi:HSP20 family protein